jgi:CPA1 family monovalent cation:H+ antiporter
MSAPIALVLGLTAAVAFAIVSKRLALPYPIVFVIAGAVIAFIPGMPTVQIKPEWVFVSILPPLLFAGGWQTDYTLFRENARPIFGLAIGLVIVSTIAVAFIAHSIVPGLGLASAFVLGAIVSPPDAVAAAATFERFQIPRRIRAIVEGEGLVNDASALVIYAYAVAAVTTGFFSVPEAAGSFLLVVAGGIAVGAGIAWGVERLSTTLHRFDLSDSLIDNLTLIAAPYAAYLLGQGLHVSGVLATVVAGIQLSRRSTVVYSPETRLIATNVWWLWVFLLNAYVFLTIGLQLKPILHDGVSVTRMLPAALAISGILIAVRLAWVYASRQPRSWALIMGWTGMRGIVSLAAALALPYDFPGRVQILFVAIIVIFITLVGQGLSLIPLIRWLHVAEEEGGELRDLSVRIAALQAGLEAIERMSGKATDDHERQLVDRLRGEYESRINLLSGHVDQDDPHEWAEHSEFDRRLQRRALRAERKSVMTMRDRGEIPDEIFRRIQYDLDLAETRLA